MYHRKGINFYIMAVSQDFEARRRERLKRQRLQKQKMRRIRLAAVTVISVLVIIFIIVGISKCSGGNEAQNNDAANNAVVTQVPFATAAPTPAVSESSIPAPVKGDNNFLDEIMRSGQKKHVYLTFDDGPNDSITPQILDVLRRYNVKATFFMVGKYIEKTPYMCTRVIEEGHLAAPHSYTHDYATVYASEENFRDEVEKTYQLIVANTPGNVEPFKIFRFPGGSFDTDRYGSVKGTYKNALADMGYYYCDWNSLTGDAEGAAKDAQGLINYFDSTRPNVNNLIILMHDTVNKQSTVDALPTLIEKLISEGYTFSRLDELDYSNASQVSSSESPTQSVDDSSDSSSDNSTSDSSSSSTSSGSGSSSSGSSSGSTSSGSGSSSSGSSSGSSSSGSSSSSRSSSSDSSSSSSNENSGDSGKSSSDGGSSTITSTTPSGQTTQREEGNVLDPE